MAERFLKTQDHQRGQVLWGMLVMLGVLMDLALSSLQLATQDGIAAGLLEQRLLQEQRLHVIARQVSQLPVPERSAPVSALWHPASDSLHQGCGQRDRSSDVAMRATCSSPGQPLLASRRQAGEWQWRLLPIRDANLANEGSDVDAFPGLQATGWELQVIVAEQGGHAVRGLWQQYQQISP